MPEPCVFPACTSPADLRRTDGTVSCHLHEHVAISTTGSWVPDHHTEGGHG